MGRKTIELEVRAERAAPTEMAAPAEHRTSQRTQTSRHPGQPSAVSEESSNVAAHSARESQWLIAALLNQRATKASALPKNPRFSGAPMKMHGTLIARSSHYHRTHKHV